MLGGSPVIQQMAHGPREAVTVFYAYGKVWATFVQVAYRTTPVLGGVSVVREGIPMPADLESAALRSVRNLDLEGCCEVEFPPRCRGSPAFDGDQRPLVRFGRKWQLDQAYRSPLCSGQWAAR